MYVAGAKRGRGEGVIRKWRPEFPASRGLSPREKNVSLAVRDLSGP